MHAYYARGRRSRMYSGSHTWGLPSRLTSWRWSTQRHSGEDRQSHVPLRQVKADSWFTWSVCFSQTEAVPSSRLLSLVCMWDMAPKRTMRQINGVNSRMLAPFTTKSIPQETRDSPVVDEFRSGAEHQKTQTDMYRAYSTWSRKGATCVSSGGGAKSSGQIRKPPDGCPDLPPDWIEQLAQTARDRAYWRALVRRCAI